MGTNLAQNLTCTSCGNRPAPYARESRAPQPASPYGSGSVFPMSSSPPPAAGRSGSAASSNTNMGRGTPGAEPTNSGALPASWGGFSIGAPLEQQQRFNQDGHSNAFDSGGNRSPTSAAQQQQQQRRNSIQAQLGTGSPANVRAALDTHRQQQAALSAALREGESSREQVQYLQQVLQSSRQYGQGVEAAIEHLANLLHKKTVECEQLRALANENYAPLRSAVRSQFETSVRQEARQQAELRQLQSQIESLLTERTKMQQEITSLKALNKELEAAPPHASYNPSDKNLLFNRLAGGDGAAASAAAAQNSSRGAADGPSVTSWNTSNHQVQPSVPSQRDFMNVLSSIDDSTALKLERAGLFDMLKVVCARMCTQAKGMPPGHYPNLSDVVAHVLRERRDVANGGPHQIASEAANPVPQVVTSDRQRATNLFLANNPNQFDELNMLLSQYEGRERDLYNKLKAQYESGGVDLSAPRDAKTLGAQANRPGTGGTDATTELHARIMIMYRKYNPSKIGSRDLNDLLSKYPPELLLSSLVEKYGPEPTGDERRALIQSIAA